jgi:hypothetical protein
MVVVGEEELISSFRVRSIRTKCLTSLLVRFQLIVNASVFFCFNIVFDEHE